MLLNVVLAEEVRDVGWVRGRAGISTTVDGGVDELLDTGLQGTVDEGFALGFFATGAAFSVGSLALLLVKGVSMEMRFSGERETYLNGEDTPNGFRSGFEDGIGVVEITLKNLDAVALGSEFLR